MSENAYFEDFKARKAREHGNRWDPSDLEAAAQFIPYFHSDQRIRVANDHYERTGTVGVTTGWKPAFLLKHRSNASGSWDLLGPRDKIVAVKRGRGYVPVQGR